MIKLIGEAGQNHNGDMGVVDELINLASIAGFNYVKFQKRNNEIAIPEEKKEEIRQTPWGEMHYIDYREKLELDADNFQFIDDLCKQKRIGWFASVWDIDSAEFMTDFVNIVKIPSALIANKELLDYCKIAFGYKIMSTGMSTEKEIEEAVELLKPDAILHCNSSYPANVDELNLKYISWLKEKYPKIQIGYSGHEFGLVTTFAVVSMGVEWIERHITLNRLMWGSDQLSSIEPEGMFKLVRGIRNIEQAMGYPKPRTVYDSEKQKRKDLRK